MAVDPVLFGRALARLPTGVSVASSKGPDGTPAGKTAGTVTSLSLEPPPAPMRVDRARDEPLPVERADAAERSPLLRFRSACRPPG